MRSWAPIEGNDRKKMEKPMRFTIMLMVCAAAWILASWLDERERRRRRISRTAGELASLKVASSPLPKARTLSPRFLKLQLTREKL